MLLYKIIKEHDLHYGTLHRKFLRISIRKSNIQSSQRAFVSREMSDYAFYH